MKPDQFLYWLQGWFEIESDVIINSTKTKIIKQHIDLTLKCVELTDKSTLDNKLLPTIYEIKGIIEASLSGVNQEHTTHIKKIVNNVFKHVIDPSYGLDVQDALNDIHFQKFPDIFKKNDIFNQSHPDDGLMRC